jgi:hypothetical protein
MTLKEILAKGQHAELAEAVKHQNEMAYYTELRQSNPHSGEFDKRVKTIYNGNNHKVRRFKDAFQGKRMPSFDVMATVWGDLYKVWNAADSYYSYSFAKDETKPAALDWLSKSEGWWKNEFWQFLKTSYNSVIVIDLPAKKSNPPEPYQVIIDISRIKYIDRDNVVFAQGEDIHWYDTKSYRIFDKNQKLKGDEVTHSLGYCPAIRWPMLLNAVSDVLRANPASHVVDDLFWYNFNSIEARKAGLLYLNPDKQAPQSSCGYDTGGHRCLGGKLVDLARKPIIVDDNQALCPNCGQDMHNSGGAGNVITINLESKAVEDGRVNPASPLVSYIMPDTEGYKIQIDQLKEKKKEIIEACVGARSVETREAMNDKQVQAGVESMENKLRRFAEDISEVIAFVEKTKLKLRYGASFLSNSAHVGSVFYLQSPGEIMERREKALNPIEREQLTAQLIETKYQNNPDKLKREKLLYKLLPYSSLGDIDFIKLYEAGKIAGDMAELRLLFTHLIDLFEAERGDIVEFYERRFAESVPSVKRLNVIKGEIFKLKTENYGSQNQVSPEGDE